MTHVPMPNPVCTLILTRSRLIFVLFLLCPSAVLADRSQAAFARIQILESSRRTEQSQWRRFISHSNPRVRQAALRAIGRIESADLSALVESQLTNSDKDVRGAAVAAYGRLPGATTQTLKSMLLTEKDPKVRLNLVKAVARLGSNQDVEALIKAAMDPDGALRAAALIGLADLAGRSNQALPGFAPDMFASHLSDVSEAVRFGMAYLLSRSAELPSQTAFDWAQTCLKDTSGEVRAVCTEALGRYGAASKPLRLQMTQDSDWRVRVALAQANATAGDIEAITLRLDALALQLKTDLSPARGPERHEIVTLLEVALLFPANSKISDVAKRIYAALGEVNVGSTESDMGLGGLACAAAAVADMVNGSAKLTKTCGGKAYPNRLREPWIVRSFAGLKPAARAKALGAVYPKLTTAGRAAVLQNLSEIPLTPQSKALLLKALESATPTIVGSAADTCAALGLKESLNPLMAAYQDAYQSGRFLVVQSIFEALGVLKAKEATSILERHTNDSQPGVRRSARDALKRIDQATRQSSAQSRRGAIVPGRRGLLPPPAETMDGEDVDLKLIKISPYTAATIETKRGPIKIKLLTREARDTVKNFVRLAQKGFYRGLTFHRVVPNFVIQGGDPEGTGWGGPGYTIPCEVNDEPFVTGTVGMALSGKDTGGSQFFITQSRAPQLDGRYTIFGRVISGQKVVDAIAPGDQILGVVLHKNQ